MARSKSPFFALEEVVRKLGGRKLCSQYDTIGTALWKAWRLLRAGRISRTEVRATGARGFFRDRFAVPKRGSYLSPTQSSDALFCRHWQRISAVAGF